MQRPDDDIRPALRQGLPGTAQHAIDKNQPRDAMALIERLNKRSKQGERESIINPNHQLIFPALVKFDGLFSSSRTVCSTSRPFPVASALCG